MVYLDSPSQDGRQWNHVGCMDCDGSNPTVDGWQRRAPSNAVQKTPGASAADGSSQYTVSRCRKNNTLYGPIHGFDGALTQCGIDTRSNAKDWWVVTNARNGVVTCKKCLVSLKTPPKNFHRGCKECKKYGLRCAFHCSVCGQGQMVMLKGEDRCSGCIPAKEWMERRKQARSSAAVGKAAKK